MQLVDHQSGTSDDLHPNLGDKPSQRSFPAELPSRRRPAPLDEDEQLRESHVLLWALGTLALAALTAGGFYWYRTLGPNLDKMSLLPAMQDQIGAAGRRIDAAEASLRNWASQREAWSRRITAMESRIDGTLQAARKQTEQIVGRSQQNIRAELDRRTSGLQNKLDRVQTAQASENTQLGHLEEQLNQLQAANNREVEQLREELRQARSTNDAAMANVDRRITSVDQRSSQSATDLESIHRKVDQERTNFELGLNHERQLAQGISMNLDHADVSHQRFDGWLWLMPDRKTVWLHSRGIQQPLTFYTAGDERPRELVITRVTKYSVIGYILMPRQSAATNDARDLAAPVSQVAK